MPLPDVLPGLKSGAIDGLEANYGLIVTQKFNEAAKYVTVDVTLWPFPAAVVINQDQWDKLSADQQKILTDAGKNLAANSIKVFTNPAPGATNFVQVLCDAGMTFASAGEANRAALAKKAQPAMDELAANADTKDFLKQIQDLKASMGPPAAPPALPAGCKTS
jgi:TRAP-type C4-dicarboxylate transport system substrate-binding protein